MGDLEEALDRLPEAFKGKPNLAGLIESLLAPWADLRQVFTDLMTLRTIDTATGEQLKVIARIVGQKPIGGSELFFRSLARARIRANKSRGVTHDIARIIRLALETYAISISNTTMKVQVDNTGTASFVVRVFGIDLPWELSRLVVDNFLRETIAGVGIRAVFEFTPHLDPDTNRHQGTFRFSGGGTGRGFNQGTFKASME